MHEVHRPDFIGSSGRMQRFGFTPLDPPFGFDPQIELQFPVDAVDPFVVP